jgi:hypothetical protein
LNSIPFVIETDFAQLPLALQQKPIVQARALTISQVKQADRTDKPPYVGTLFASESFRKAQLKGITTSFYDELANVYRVIYGNAPWNEFLVCSQAECLGKKSISDVHGLPIEYQPSLNELEAQSPTIPENHMCPICGSPMRFYYPSSKILPMIEREFNDDVVAAFIFDHDGLMQGFSWAWFGDANVVARKLQDQLRCTSDSPLIDVTKNYLQGNQCRHALFLSEWAVAYAYRNTIFSFLLMVCINFLGRDRAADRNDRGPIFLGVTLEGSSSYNLYRHFGAQTIFSDPNTKAVIMSNPLQRGFEQYERVERVLTKRLLRKRRYGFSGTG